MATAVCGTFHSSSSHYNSSSPQLNCHQKNSCDSNEQESKFQSFFTGPGLSSEKYRENSFLFYPPKATLPAPVEELVAGGFYYTGENTRIVCYSCGMVLSSMEHDSSLLEFHKRSSPNCNHLKSLKTGKSRNVKRDLKQVEDRLQTFTSTSSCPESVLHLKTRLADAGFYYTDRSDVVKCAFCHIELHVAKLAADPLDNHLKFSPACSFASSQRRSLKSRPRNKCNRGRSSSTESSPDRENLTERDRILNLKAENDKMRQSVTCVKCRVAPVQIVTLPCTHLACCEECGEAVDDCPKCGERILGTVKIFMA